ncbi:MAG TPA: class I SAM-dependent methyltransferase [Candidatus Krumholzibacteria bacterium]|nr:class I SAM-dependent methyltransferase [Candidatus Krumholzibacteria bacterium]
MSYTIRAAFRHAHAAISRLVDRHFDIAFGSDTRGVVENAALSDVASPNLTRGIRYEPTRALPLKHVLRAAHVPTDGAFVDLGCGKGRALMVAVLSGFTHVTGVDYSPALCRIAEHNLETLRRRTQRSFTVSIMHGDAADYTFDGRDTVLYLFNPFDAIVLAAVVAHLERSLAQQPRAVWIVYHNPVWRVVIEHSGAFAHVRDYTSGTGVFAVYKSR